MIITLYLTVKHCRGCITSVLIYLLNVQQYGEVLIHVTGRLTCVCEVPGLSGLSQTAGKCVQMLALYRARHLTSPG